MPGDCAGPGTTTPNYPGPCAWNLYSAQANLNAGPARTTWAITQIILTPMHMGDICNLGIACIPKVSNRHLLDFIQAALDLQGCMHIGYADDNIVPNRLRAANQTSGCIPNSGQTFGD